MFPATMPVITTGNIFNVFIAGEKCVPQKVIILSWAEVFEYVLYISLNSGFNVI